MVCQARYGENQEPGNPVTSTNLAAYGAEKIAKTMPAVRTEYPITDIKDGYRENNHSNEEQTEEQAQLAKGDMSKGVFFFCHVLHAVCKIWRIVAYGRVKIKRSLVAVVILVHSTMVNHDAHMHASSGKEKIVWEDPEPVPDVQSRNQRRNARTNVEIG